MLWQTNLHNASLTIAVSVLLPFGSPNFDSHSLRDSWIAAAARPSGLQNDVYVDDKFSRTAKIQRHSNPRRLPLRRSSKTIH